MESCSFCLKREDQVKTLVSTPGASPVRAFICDECIGQCHFILGEMEEGRDIGFPIRAAAPG